MLPSLVLLTAGAIKLISADPFSGHFTPFHLAPHLLGLDLIVLASMMAYGSDFKGAWVFQLAPVGVFHPFARGVHAFLWIAGALVPNLLLFAPLAWFWGVWHAALFTVFSVSAASVYLAFALRLIESVPFSRQPEVKRGAMALPLMMLVFLVAGIASAIQHFLIFRSPAAVLAAAALLGAAAWALTRWSLTALEANMRFSLGLISGESKLLYTEVD